MQTFINRRQWLQSTAIAVASLALSGVDVFAAETSNDRNFVWLDKNENTFGISEKSAQAIMSAVNSSNRYPFREQEALTKIIAAHEKVPIDYVLLGSGCTEIFSLACMLYGANGKEVLVAEPSYFLFNRYVEQVRGKLLRVPMNENWEPDLDTMTQRTTNSTSLVYVCNPNNPIGTVADPVRLRQFCENLANRSMVFVDEAYYEFVEDSQRASMISLVREGAKLVVGRTFSKLYGLAGLRIGYGVGNPQIIAEMRRIQMKAPPAPVNTLAIAAASAIYVDSDYVPMVRQRNAKIRAQFYALLEKLGYTPIPSSQANFVIFQTPGGKKRLVANLWKQYNIRVRAFHFLGKDWVRVTMGTPEEMDRLTTALTELA
jgi:histidinol-phosphate aminotransferase